MKKLILLSIISSAMLFFLVSCEEQHRCPTYSDSGAKWKGNHGHPYGGNHRKPR